MAGAMRAHERAIEAIELGMAGRKASEGPRKPPRGRRRRDEGGEPAPVLPRPKPMPLTGAAAAPIE